jgi:DNA (cytosine-5)-methyltransferase 1
MTQLGFLEESSDFEVLPPYARPTLEEVKGRPRNGLKAVGSFSGCGGSSCGLKAAGWEVLAAVEFIPAAAETYRANFPETYVFEKDIRNLTVQEILDKTGLRPGELDLFEGSPPCASFSAAGAGEKDWGKTKKYSDSEQRTDDLFYEWVRLLEGLRPRAFIAENVPGMINGNALSEYAHKITAELSKLGYHVRAQVLNAANYGVPQERERLIFVGVRMDQDVDRWEYPPPTTPVPHSLEQALADVRGQSRADLDASSMEGKAVGRTWHAYQEAYAAGLTRPDFAKLPCARCGKTVGLGGHMEGEGDDAVPVGGRPENGHTVQKWSKEGLPLKATCADGEKSWIVKDYFLLVVPDAKRPCPTLTATGSGVGAASVAHPTECRKFTPAEALSISGFPVNFKLTGTREQRYERVGRAVPPPLYEALGRRLAELLG